MKTVKQPMGSRSCGAAVAAMLTNKELREVLDGRDEAALSKTSDLARYLLDNGWMMGTSIIPNNKRFTTNKFTATVDLESTLAILSVPGREDKWSHWVLWDGIAGGVRDPNPLCGELRMISSYKVQEFWMLREI